MTAASQYPAANPIAADALALPAALRPLLVPALALVAFLVLWVAATVAYGFNGFIGGADAAVLITFGTILTATRQ